ncbi:MAG: ribonuclease H-like domain-containing protein [Thermoplasmata archaeon]|uniref:Ribonuclease H-like domain-containing protein n=1 Tax=Candidatus Sysuiplasma superficiale TaxID=2823368 RepID=A0A8J7YPV5_9ARCH|nr:ribonuclease H-like domain-containing protein [Candidatus Sysuiplasma superficiale]MBX8637886.1 ribonuclease H-like domain-containing protein [Candidatus Sysuiplasma acidicola]
MLRNTFTIFRGIGPDREYALWKSGIKTWTDLLNDRRCSPSREHEITMAEDALLKSDARYFTRLISQSERWRLCYDFIQGAAFIDVELDGWSRHSEPVVIGVFAQGSFSSFVRGDNLSAVSILRKIGAATMLVSFNGARHDMHYINTVIPGICLRYPVVDIVAMARKAGLSGGLKSVERRLNIRRNRFVELSANGRAVELWHIWKKKRSRGALNLLKMYNMEDTCNLLPVSESIRDILYAKTTGGLLDG